jgi:hypothetical protein
MSRTAIALELSKVVSIFGGSLLFVSLINIHVVNPHEREVCKRNHQTHYLVEFSSIIGDTTICTPRRYAQYGG